MVIINENGFLCIATGNCHLWKFNVYANVFFVWVKFQKQVNVKVWRCEYFWDFNDFFEFEFWIFQTVKGTFKFVHSNFIQKINTYHKLKVRQNFFFGVCRKCYTVIPYIEQWCFKAFKGSNSWKWFYDAFWSINSWKVFN